MATIKEMVNDYLEEEKDEIVCIQDRCTGFEDGAMYVLSVLYNASFKEDWISDPQKGVKRFYELYKEFKK